MRREQIKLQVALITPLIHIKGYAAYETTVATERARQLIEQSTAVGEAPEDPLLLFAVLYGAWVASHVAFDGETMRNLAIQFQSFAEKQKAVVPIMIGHRILGNSLMCTGEIVAGKGHYDEAIALYDPVEHRPLAARFGQDVGVAIRSYRSLALWMLGHPDAALADVSKAIGDARQISQAATLMYVLNVTSLSLIERGNYEMAEKHAREGLAMADEKRLVH